MDSDSEDELLIDPNFLCTPASDPDPGTQTPEQNSQSSSLPISQSASVFQSSQASSSSTDNRQDSDYIAGKIYNTPYFVSKLCDFKY